MVSYSVNFWGSHPEAGNDDCWSGTDFSSLAEAREYFASSLADVPEPDCCFVELAKGVRDYEGTPFVETIEVVQVAEPSKGGDDDFDREWQREIAREEGMLGGYGAYNEVMGY